PSIASMSAASLYLQRQGNEEQHYRKHGDGDQGDVADPAVTVTAHDLAVVHQGDEWDHRERKTRCGQHHRHVGERESTDAERRWYCRDEYRNRVNRAEARVASGPQILAPFPPESLRDEICDRQRDLERCTEARDAQRCDEQPETSAAER